MFSYETICAFLYVRQNKSVAFTASLKETELIIQPWRVSSGTMNLRSFMNQAHLILLIIRCENVDWVHGVEDDGIYHHCYPDPDGIDDEELSIC